jgi:hypothetical protein
MIRDGYISAEKKIMTNKKELERIESPIFHAPTSGVYEISFMMGDKMYVWHEVRDIKNDNPRAGG